MLHSDLAAKVLVKISQNKSDVRREMMKLVRCVPCSQGKNTSPLIDVRCLVETKELHHFGSVFAHPFVFDT